MPAAATCSATSRWRSSGCSPRLTQWLAVTPCGKPVAMTRSARSSSAEHRRVRASRRCAGRRAGRPRRRWSGSCRWLRAGSVSRWGQPPTTSTPDRDRLAQQRPLVGALRRRSIGQHTAPRPGCRPGHAAARAPRPAPRTDVSPLPQVTSTCVRIAVQPLAASSRAARSARSMVSSRVIEVGGRLHRQDRAHQVAGRVVDTLGEERLVEVGVRLGERRQQQWPGRRPSRARPASTTVDVARRRRPSSAACVAQHVTRAASR